MHKRRYAFLIMHRSIICHGVLSCLILKYTVYIKPDKLVCKPTLKPKHLSPSLLPSSSLYSCTATSRCVLDWVRSRKLGRLPSVHLMRRTFDQGHFSRIGSHGSLPLATLPTSSRNPSQSVDGCYYVYIHLVVPIERLWVEDATHCRGLVLKTPFSSTAKYHVQKFRAMQNTHCILLRRCYFPTPHIPLLFAGISPQL